jgi:hypothetical protein
MPRPVTAPTQGNRDRVKRTYAKSTMTDMRRRLVRALSSK